MIFMCLSINLNNIISLIKENEDLLSIFKEVYIFGSVINNSKYNDIDILLIYRNITPELHSKKNKLKDFLENKLGYSLDITILSYNEKKEVKFLERLNSKYIKIK